MKTNKALTLEDRKHIERGLKEGKSYGGIGSLIGRHEQTVYLEIKKSGLTRSTYNAEKAQEAANRRISRMHVNRLGPFKPTDAQLSTIKTYMEQGKSKKDMRDALGISTKRWQTYLRNNHAHHKSTYGQGMLPLESRIVALEMQVEILLEQVKKLTQRS